MAGALPDRRHADGPPGGFDTTGFVLVGAVTALLLLAVVPPAPRALGALAGCVTAALLYRRHARRAADPILQTRFLTTAPFGVLNLLGFAAFAVPWGLAVYLPLLMVSGLQEGAATGALAVSALSAGWLTGALVSGFLLRSGSGAITAELALAALALASTAGAVVLGPTTSAPTVVLLGTVLGVAGGLLNNATLGMVTDAARTEEIGATMAPHQYVRNLGNALGTALTGGVILGVLARQGVEAADVLGAEADLGVTGQPVVDGFRLALATAAGISAVVFALFVRSNRRSRTVLTQE
jgi:hypothetical protein